MAEKAETGFKCELKSGRCQTVVHMGSWLSLDVSGRTYVKQGKRHTEQQNNEFCFPGHSD